MNQRTDLPSNAATRRDILLAERAFGQQDVLWDPAGRWILIQNWRIPRSHTRYNVASTPVLVMVPDGYGLRSGHGAGLEEFYVRPDLRFWSGSAWSELPHTYANYDRRAGRAISNGWRYHCVHVQWDPRRENILHAMNHLALCLADPIQFERLAQGNGGRRG